VARFAEFGKNGRSIGVATPHAAFAATLSPKVMILCVVTTPVEFTK
jgi:hypothetical protein